MNSRHVTTGITLLVLCGLLVAGLVVGVQQLFAPIDTGSDEPVSACEDTSLRRGDRLRTDQVVVNVFNAGTRAGLAGEVLEAMARRGFVAGETGNAAADRVRRVQVWVTEGEQTAGRLVARNFGRNTLVMARQDLAPGGPDVVVADGYAGLGRPKRVATVLTEQEICLAPTG